MIARNIFFPLNDLRTSHSAICEVVTDSCLIVMNEVNIFCVLYILNLKKKFQNFFKIFLKFLKSFLKFFLNIGKDFPLGNVLQEYKYHDDYAVLFE